MKPYRSSATPVRPVTRAANAADETTTGSLTRLWAEGHVQDEELPALEQVAREFAVAITPQMLDLIEPGISDDPIARQFVPDTRELDRDHQERTDPIGDESHSPVTGIVHRYPDRVLLMPVTICPVYCRFCFRRETVGAETDALLSDQQLDEAIEYIRSRVNIWEVILSGGDPLVLSTRRLQRILAALRSIPHVKVIRIHTRVPTVSPEKISVEMVRILRDAAPVYVVLHCNHPRELTSAARNACARLVDGGIPMLSQTVLLKNINDDTQTLMELMRSLVESRVKPYYLHHPDLARGTGHFRSSISQGQELMAELRGRLSGVCQPAYVLDIPGGFGKSPIGPGYLESDGNGRYLITDFHGKRHVYHDHAHISPEG